jgi:uncharacterized membrane protein
MNAVFTINFGDHDLLKEPVKTQNWDYICFTNNDIQSKGWEIRKVETDLENRLAARWVYINSHLFLQDYDFTILVGGQIKIDGNLNNFVNTYFNLNKLINVMEHPCRKCIYKEAEIVMRENIDTVDRVFPQIQRYHSEGFPVDFGLSACGIIGRWRNPKVEEFEKAWWEEVKSGSHRDQLSFDYIRWKLKFDSIHWLPYDVLFGKYFSVYIRKTERRIGYL